MDDIKVILPCGFSTSLKNLKNKPSSIKCLVCGTHNIDLEECFNLPQNRFSIRKKESEIEIEELKKLRKKLNHIRRNPNAHIEKSFERILDFFDQRRKEIKRELEEKVDEHYMNLYKMINTEKNLILKEFEENSKKSFSIVNFNKSFEKNETDFGKKNKSIEQLLVDIKAVKNQVSNLISLAEKGESYKILNQNLEINISNLKECFGVIILDDEEIELKNFSNEFKEEKPFSYEHKACLHGHDNFVTCIDTLNEKLFSGSFDKTIKLWDTEKGTCLKTYQGKTGMIFCLKILDENLLATGSDDCNVTIWDIQTGDCIKTLKGHTDWVLCLKLLKNGLIASGSVDKSIKIWDYKEESCIKTLEGHSRAVNCLEDTDNGKIISGSTDKSIKIWSSISELSLKNLEGHTAAVNVLKLINKHEILSGSWDKTIRLWRIENGQCLQIFHGHTKGVTSLDIIDEEFFISGSWDSKFKIWNIKSGSFVKSIETNLNNIKKLIVDKNKIISCSDNKIINIWNKIYDLKL